MRSSIVRGHIKTPRSLAAARVRYHQLVVEVARITAQLDGSGMAEKLVTRDAYDTWRMKAKRAHRYMTEEMHQLALWIDAHPETGLLREARDLLVALRADLDEDAFSVEELAVIARLEAACEDRPVQAPARQVQG